MHNKDTTQCYFTQKDRGSKKPVIFCAQHKVTTLMEGYLQQMHRDCSSYAKTSELLTFGSYIIVFQAT